VSTVLVLLRDNRLRWKIELGRIHYCSTYFLTLHSGVGPLLWPYTLSKKERIAYQLQKNSCLKQTHFLPREILRNQFSSWSLLSFFVYLQSRMSIYLSFWKWLAHCSSSIFLRLTPQEMLHVLLNTYSLTCSENYYLMK